MSLYSSRTKSVMVGAAFAALGAACSSSAVDPLASRSTAPLEAETCSEIETAMRSWVSEHRRCGDGLSCEYIPQLDTVNICEIVAPGSDRPELDALFQAYKDKGCDPGASCPHGPGNAVCENGTCAWKVDTSCFDCPTDLDPVCTTNNMNATNACRAEHCLHAEIAHKGFCEDSAECKAARGTCEEWVSATEPLCPDGTRWEGPFWAPEATKGCAGGNYQTTCCTPFRPRCSYVGNTMTLSVDPFTCAPPSREHGLPWTCLHPDEQRSCHFGAELSQPLNPSGPYKAHIAIEARYGNKVTVRGYQRETGRRFRCTGKVSYAVDLANEWQCDACDGDNCTSCIAEQTYLCKL